MFSNNLKTIHNLKDSIKSYIIEKNIYKTGPNTKYSLDLLLDVIIYVMETGISWRSLNSPIHGGRFRWQSFYGFYHKLCTMNVFEIVYMTFLNCYMSKNKSLKLKYLSTDTMNIKNEYGSNAKCNFGYTGKKRMFKLSLIVDSNGIPLSTIIDKGSVSDQCLLMANLNNMHIDITYNKPNNKSKRYMLADSIYDTNNIRDTLKRLNIKPIIAPNKRKTLDEELIRRKQLTKSEKKIYRKRTVNENCFSWINKNRRLSKRYDKNDEKFKGFLFMSFIKIILKRMK